MSTYHCPRCAEIAQRKQYRQKVNTESKEYSSKSKSGKKIKDKKQEKSFENGAAILAKIENRIPIQDKIVFSMGIGNNKSFHVSEDGKKFIFTQPGLYRIVFKGRISNVGKIILHRSPPVNKEQDSFTKYSFGGNIQELSTMLPFESGYELSIQFASQNDVQSFLEAGAQIEIYKVDDI